MARYSKENTSYIIKQIQKNKANYLTKIIINKNKSNENLSKKLKIDDISKV